MQNDLVMATMLLGIMGAIGGAIYKFGSYVVHRLFDEDKGLVSKALSEWHGQNAEAIRNQKEFMDGLADRDKVQMQFCEQHTSIATGTQRRIDSLQKASLEAVGIARELLNAVPPGNLANVETKLANIERELSQ